MCIRDSAGLDPNDLPEGDISAMNKLTDGGSGSKAWKDIWGCGQGIGAVKQIQSVSERVSQMRAEYLAAKKRLAI